jgi:hypothetical protein
MRPYGVTRVGPVAVTNHRHAYFVQADRWPNPPKSIRHGHRPSAKKRARRGDKAAARE